MWRDKAKRVGPEHLVIRAMATAVQETAVEIGQGRHQLCFEWIGQGKGLRGIADHSDGHRWIEQGQEQVTPGEGGRPGHRRMTTRWRERQLQTPLREEGLVALAVEAFFGESREMLGKSQ